MLFIASVLDLGSLRLLGYSMADHMRTELVSLDGAPLVTLRGVALWVFRGGAAPQCFTPGTFAGHTWLRRFAGDR